MIGWRLRIAATALGAALLPFVAAAHVTVDTADGKYAVELGFEHEPAYLGQPNALFVKVGEYATGGTKPVDGLVGALTAEVEKDGQTQELDLTPQGDGVYLGVFYPTALGDYTFRVSGDINGSPVNIEESSSPTTFDPVQSLAAAEFPAPLPSVVDVAAQAESAASAAQSARLFAIIGIIVGALGLVVGGTAFAAARRQ
ncbi:MAG: hypothetical protein IT337_01515 [Thermomicrobiales bacterium]|nr:hypothetical protein [Thermomicrobiales bacterium]